MPLYRTVVDGHHERNISADTPELAARKAVCEVVRFSAPDRLGETLYVTVRADESEPLQWFEVSTSVRARIVGRK